MNHIYRIVWNQALNAWVVVAESARGRGKGSSRKLVAAALSLTASFAQAAPAGGQVVSGAGNIAQSGNTTTITQSSQNLSLNWQSFNIAKQETVNFVQPSASAIAVNRIFDTNGSQILGHLNANGQVYLINPNGILFGQGAQVNVGSLVASTLNLNGASLSGNSRLFSGTGTGSIVNQGTINAANGGYVALLGNTVSNQGTITAPQGTVALGAGSAVTLNFNGNSLVKMQIDQSVLNSLAESGGLIKADGGLVVMNAGAKDALLASVVNNTGKIEARTVENHEGTITLLGGMAAGTVNVGGTLDASAPNGGNGGFIETSAAHVKIADDASITTAAAAATGTAGHWLIDPMDFTIAASNGDITGANLGTLLASNSITIQTATSPNASPTNLIGITGSNGDIHVNDAVSWSADNTLTLNAWRNININKYITATGTSGKLTLKYGQGATDGVIGGVAATYNVNAPVNLKAGNNFSTQLGSTGSVKNYTVITSLGAQGSSTATDLQGMNGNLDANYVLGSNIDATATSGWDSGAGFAPITRSQTTLDTGYFCITYGECMNQTQLTPFTGTFDGLGHSISALTINRPSTENVGLFGQTSTTAQIRNIGLVGGSVTGQGWVGALVGDNSGTISNSYATGSVTGTNSYIGGLVGAMHSSTISNSYSTGNVNGGSYSGGLLGFNDNGAIANSHATGSVLGSTSVGGLVGTSYNSSISNSYASGSVTGDSRNVGGLAGESSGTVSNSYASGPVQGSNWSGGLLGYNTGTLSNSYATGSVSGTSLVGGLVGNNQGAVSTSYATGGVSGTFYVGGLLGYNNKLVSYSYANGRVVGTDAGSNGGLAGVNDGDVSFSYWNKDSTTKGIGRGSLTGATGLTTAQMQTAANFASFNFTSTPGAAGNNWVMVDADGSLNNAGGSLGATRPMLASEYSTTINNAHQLQLMAMAPTANYSLGTNFNAAITGLIGGISTDVWGSAGFVPIGNSSSNFTGTFDGLDHTIAGLYINSSSNNAALFGYTSSSAIIRNVGLVGGSVDSTGYIIGFLVGSNAGSVLNSYATGNVSGRGIVGGLVGGNFSGAIESSYATGSVQGTDGSIGGLVGQSYSIASSISNSYATGNVSGSYTVGGLLGNNSLGRISNSHATGNVAVTSTGNGFKFGGLVGENIGTIDYSYATGSVNGGESVGGLAGFNDSGTISNSYAAGSVLGFTDVGGLVGLNMAGSSASLNATITNSYASGSVEGTGDKVGGLVGSNQGGYGSGGGSGTASIRNAYATGPVTGGNYVGGLVGLNAGGQGGYGSGDFGGTASITNTYATGPVTGGNHVGGLVGSNANGAAGYGMMGPGGMGPGGMSSGGAGGLGSISNGFWDTATSTRANGINASESQTGVTGLDSSQMMQLASFSSWNTATPHSIANTGGSGAVWRIYEGHTAPLLTSFMTGLTLVDASVTYNGTEKTGTTTTLSGVSGIAAKGTNAGNYRNGYYSSQQGYDISGGNLTINAAALSAISLNGTRAYDGTVDVAASIFTLSGLVNGQDLTINGVGTVASKNVGAYSVNLGSLALENGSNGLASNYTFTGGTQTATITKADLSVTATAVTKTYDSTLTASGSASIGTIAGAAASESVLSSGTQAFLDKNAGTGNKTVRASGVTIKDAGGVDVSSNYTIAYTDNTTSNITPASLTVSGLAASNKVYDTTTSAVLGGTAAVTALSGDTVTLTGTATGVFANKNVANGKTVTTSGLSLSGADAGNYTLVQQSTSADITPAQLIYLATPRSFLNGQTPNDLSGTVNGFAGGDTLSNATSGQLTWSTSANAGSKPGLYAIDGNGLLASNYSFSQAAGNSTALAFTPATPPAPVLNVMTQLTSITALLQAIVPPTVLSISPVITVTQTNRVETAGSSTGSTSKPDKVAVANTAMTIGATGPAMLIVNGGMRLPTDMVNVNE